MMERNKRKFWRQKIEKENSIGWFES